MSLRWCKRLRADHLDIAARYGGEEFVLGLFDLSAENIREMADQLRKAIHDLNITHEDSCDCPLRDSEHRRGHRCTEDRA